MKLLILALLTAITAVGQTPQAPSKAVVHGRYERAFRGSQVTQVKPGDGAIYGDYPRVVKLSDEEYARLQKLRQAVVDAEMAIAKAHGVYFAPPPDPYPHFIACDSLIGCFAKPTDHYQFRGQYLLINVPKQNRD